jgi:protocatechuate 3,4-dioxygenase beta subunit
MELPVSPRQPYSAASFARAWYSPLATSYSGAIRLPGTAPDSFVALVGQRFKARRRRNNQDGAILLVHHAEEKNMLLAHPSRRQILRSTLISSGLSFAIGYPALTFAQSAAPTPQCHDPDEATIRQTEGPYFKPSSPQSADLAEPDTKAQLVEINGQVLTRSCRPVEKALVDLWHANERGEYDNAGFRYRGHLFTDREGRYRFRTILPALYPGRTRHYHVKVQAPERSVLTTQLYFPDEPANRRDGLFRRDLVMRITEAPAGLAARFDFVLDMR